MTTPARVCVVGLGKLGAPLAACLAAKGLTVIGVDRDPRKVRAIEQNKPPVNEPGLAELLTQTQGRLTAVQDVEAAVAQTDITFIVVSTPSEPSGGFSLRYVEPVAQAIGHALARKNDYHLVCLTSTVMPGTTGGPVREMLQQASGKKVGADFGLCYSPEFIALGSVIRDFLNPDLLLIGESDTRAGDTLQSLYARVCENKPAVARMSFVNAEITKLAVNTYVTTKISYANMIARICERLSGANVDVITSALGLDTRIGSKYLKGALSYGGPCFPRDNLALAQLACQLGVPADLAQTVDRFNRSQVSWLADLVQQRTKKAAGILGLTYKAGTDVVEEAAGFLLAGELANRGVKVLAFDPAFGQHSSTTLPEYITLAATAAQCIEQSDVVILATAWPEFDSISRAQWTHNSNHATRRTVIDCWRTLKFLHDEPGIHYIGLGLGETLV
jgi:UDPglucose 6-dehydrogenase